MGYVVSRFCECLYKSVRIC